MTHHSPLAPLNSYPLLDFAPTEQAAAGEFEAPRSMHKQ